MPTAIELEDSSRTFEADPAGLASALDKPGTAHVSTAHVAWLAPFIYRENIRTPFGPQDTTA